MGGRDKGAGMTGRGLRRCLAVGLLGLVGGVALVGQGAAVKDSHAGVFRPGGMAPCDTRRALAHDAQAPDGCLRAGTMPTSSASSIGNRFRDPFGTALVAGLVYWPRVPGGRRP